MFLVLCNATENLIPVHSEAVGMVSEVIRANCKFKMSPSKLQSSFENMNSGVRGHRLQKSCGDSRQFKQHEKRLLKVVTVNLPLYKQLY
jgi:hypothetical protein